MRTLNNIWELISAFEVSRNRFIFVMFLTGGAWCFFPVIVTTVIITIIISTIVVVNIVTTKIKEKEEEYRKYEDRQTLVWFWFKLICFIALLYNIPSLLETSWEIPANAVWIPGAMTTGIIMVLHMFKIFGKHEYRKIIKL